MRGEIEDLIDRQVDAIVFAGGRTATAPCPLGSGASVGSPPR
jgi:hypothetical protein